MHKETTVSKVQLCKRTTNWKIGKKLKRRLEALEARAGSSSADDSDESSEIDRESEDKRWAEEVNIDEIQISPEATIAKGTNVRDDAAAETKVSKGEPSPGTREAEVRNRLKMRGEQWEKKMPSWDRTVPSGIACTRCRRDKVECELYRAAQLGIS